MSIMVSTSFTSFLLILILLPLRFSSGHANQVKNRVTLATSGSRTATSNMHVEIYEYEGVSVVAEIDQGRKLMITKGLSSETKSDEHWNTEHVRVKLPGFVSLNADYHVPRPHPPKNN